MCKSPSDGEVAAEAQEAEEAEEAEGADAPKMAGRGDAGTCRDAETAKWWSAEEA